MLFLCLSVVVRVHWGLLHSDQSVLNALVNGGVDKELSVRLQIPGTGELFCVIHISLVDLLIFVLMSQIMLSNGLDVIIV